MNFKEYIKASIEYNIVKKFYDLLVSDVEIFDDFKSCTRKKLSVLLSADIGFNKHLYNEIVHLFFEQPIKRIANSTDIITIDDKQKSITIKKPSSISLIHFYDLIKQECWKAIQKCINNYKNKDISNFNELYNFESYAETNLINGLEKVQISVRSRKHQNIFAKQVKDRDQKCLICCEDLPFVLQACHIKSFSECETVNEQYDACNGITLCANHHQMFDKHLFTFNKNWEVKTNKDIDKNI